MCSGKSLRSSRPGPSLSPPVPASSSPRTLLDRDAAAMLLDKVLVLYSLIHPTSWREEQVVRKVGMQCPVAGAEQPNTTDLRECNDVLIVRDARTISNEILSHPIHIFVRHFACTTSLVQTHQPVPELDRAVPVLLTELTAVYEACFSCEQGFSNWIPVCVGLGMDVMDEVRVDDQTHYDDVRSTSLTSSSSKNLR
jgi:hypothetical protein